MNGTSFFRPAETAAAAWFTRYNFHPEERFEAFERLLDGAGQPSVLLLAGEPGNGRTYLVEAARFRLEQSGKPVHVLTIDLEGYEEGGDLGAYLEHQALKRREEKEEARREIQEAITELVKEGASLLSGPIAAGVSLALKTAKPVGTLLDALNKSSPTVAGSRFTEQEIFAGALRSLDGRILVHVEDATQLPELRSESSPWRWLAEIVEATPGALLAVSCEQPEEVEALLPTLRCGVERLDVGPLTLEDLQKILDLRYAPHEFPASLAATLADYSRGSGSAVLPGVVAQGVVRLRELGGLRQDEEGRWYLDEETGSDALAEGLWEPVSRFLYTLEGDRSRVLERFLFDAALCGDLVPVRHLIELQDLDDDVADESENLIKEGLVGELRLFENLKHRIPTFPADTNVYRFRDPLVRRVIFERTAISERRIRAEHILEYLKKDLPARSRDVAHLFLELARHLGEEKQSLWRRALAWWTGEDEAEQLRGELTENLKTGHLDPEDVWKMAMESQQMWPAYRRLAVLDAYEAGCGVPESRLGPFLLHRSSILLDLGRVQEALTDAEEAEPVLREREGRHGPWHRNALWLWARSALEAGKLDLARMKFEEVLNVQRRVLGEEHHSTLTTRHELARVLNVQGELSRARAEFEDVLEMRRRLLGEEHPSTLITRHSLAGVLRDQGELTIARAEFEEVLKLCRRVLGEEDFATLAIRHNLAEVLHTLGALDRARAEFEGVLEIQRRLLGEEHPRTLAARHELARVLDAQGELTIARAECEGVLQVQRRALGEEHPDTLAVRHNLAGLLQTLGELDRARAEFEGVLEIQRRLLGEEHRRTLVTRANLASVLLEQGEMSAARAEYDAVLEVLRRVLGEEHPDTLIGRFQRAKLLKEVGEFRGARTELEKILAAAVEIWEADFEGPLKVRVEFAEVLEEMGDVKEARKQYERVLELICGSSQRWDELAERAQGGIDRVVEA